MLGTFWGESALDGMFTIRNYQGVEAGIKQEKSLHLLCDEKAQFVHLGHCPAEGTSRGLRELWSGTLRNSRQLLFVTYIWKEYQNPYL